MFPCSARGSCWLGQTRKISSEWPNATATRKVGTKPDTTNHRAAAPARPGLTQRCHSLPAMTDFTFPGLLIRCSEPKPVSGAINHGISSPGCSGWGRQEAGGGADARSCANLLNSRVMNSPSFSDSENAREPKSTVLSGCSPCRSWGREPTTHPQAPRAGHFGSFSAREHPADSSQDSHSLMLFHLYSSVPSVAIMLFKSQWNRLYTANLMSKLMSQLSEYFLWNILFFCVYYAACLK